MRGIFDTHAHYDDRAFDEDREEILVQLKEQGYSGIVDIGASFESCKKAVEISNTHDIVYATVGIHPDCIEDFFEGENNRNTSGNRVIEEMYNMIKNNKKILKYMCMAHIMQLKKTFKYIVYVTNCCVKESSRI